MPPSLCHTLFQRFTICITFYTNKYRLNKQRFSSSQAIDTLCGSGTGHECTPQGWMNFLGNGSNSPFTMYLHVTDEPIVIEDYNHKNVTAYPFNTTIHKCSVSPKLGQPACSCQVWSNILYSAYQTQ